MSSTATKPMMARNIELPLRGVGCGGAASGRVGFARRSAVERGGGGVVVVGGCCFPTTVEANSHPPSARGAASLIPMTAPHVGQKACSAPTGEPHL